MTDNEIIEIMARGMYGDGWDGPLNKQPGDKMKDVWRDYCRRTLTALRAAGLAIVPREPDDAALDVIVEAAQIYDEWGVDKYVSNPKDVYRTIIATAEGKTE